MTNWEDANEHCTAGADLADARRVCADLGIHLHHVNFAREYRDEVFADFLSELRAGRTPNPDVACNRHIKFGAFLRHALRLGADRIATGHYARHRARPGAPPLPAGGPGEGPDLFPPCRGRGRVVPDTVPAGLPREARGPPPGAGLRPAPITPSGTARASASWVNGRSAQFLAEHVSAAARTHPDRFRRSSRAAPSACPSTPWASGRASGSVAAAAACEAPWFVAAKDAARNALIVVQGGDHPGLLRQEITAGDLRWLAGEPAGIADGLDLQARIRHRHDPASCHVRLLAGGTASGPLRPAAEDAHAGPVRRPLRRRRVPGWRGHSRRRHARRIRSPVARLATA